MVGIISPFNFPAMVPMWFFPVAIAAGNTVVLKPSEKDPSAALWLAELWKEAGLPDGVFNVLQGDKVAVDALLDEPGRRGDQLRRLDPDRRSTSTRAPAGTASGCRPSAAPRTTWSCCPTPTSTWPRTPRSTPATAAPASGAWRSACWSRSTRSADDLVARIAERTRTLLIGDGGSGRRGRREADMGPLVTRAHRDRVAGFIDVRRARRRQGRRRRPRGPGRAAPTGGFWLGPTLFDNVTPEMEIYREEIFGPVLSVVRVATYDEAVALINANEYGNGTAVFTNDGGAARRFEADVEVGMIGVNVPIPVPVAYYSFGGWKRSLFGDTHAHGTEGVHFFTRGKVVTTRWIDPANRPDGRPRAGVPAQ